MPLLPLELTLTVGSAIAAFLLGLLVWWRNKWTVGGVVYSLMSMSLALWTAVDWFIGLQTTALPIQIAFWKVLYYLSISFGASFVIQAAVAVARRPSRLTVGIAYALSFLSFELLVLGSTLRTVALLPAASDVVLFAGAALALILYTGASLCIAFELYPVIFSSTATVLERRRASYGIVIFILFAFAGGLQLIIGPIPTGTLMPALAMGFIFLSLMGFIRAAFLDVVIRPLESFLLLIGAFAFVLLLRSRDQSEAVVTIIGSLAVTIFGLAAIRTVHGEVQKRETLEATNRQLKFLEDARNDFVDMVAHQLRSPLGGIRAQASMLEDGDYGDLPTKAKKAVTGIQDTATRLLSLSDTFLNASRLEIGKYVSQPASTDLRQLVDSIVKEMSFMAERKHLALKVHVAQDVPASGSIDHEVYQNALFNLLDNAIKYTDAGSVSISCRVEGGSFITEVRDTGLGMTSGELREAFDKFHRGAAGRDHAMDGTGLGLYVVKRLVEAAHGRITAESGGPGKGSLFRFSFPLHV